MTRMPKRFDHFYREFFLPLLPLFKSELRGKQRVFLKTHSEPVAEFDKEIERCFFSFIHRFFGKALVVSEETPHDWPPPQGDFFLLDPLDGTTNLLMGLNLFGIMVTEFSNFEPIASMIFHPIAEMVERSGFYWAEKDKGAWRQDSNKFVKLAVSREIQLADSILLLEGGAGVNIYHSPFITGLRQTAGSVREELSNSHDIILIASGSAVSEGARSANILVTIGNKPEDNLHGILFIEESGGRVTDFSGNPPSLTNCSDLIYSNGFVHNEALRLKEVYG